MSFKKNPVFLITLVILLTSIACRLTSPFDGTSTSSSSETTPTLESEEGVDGDETPNETVSVTNDDLAKKDLNFIVPTPDDSGSCSNIFFPLNPGMEWVYNLENTYESTQISLVVSEVTETQATLTLHDLQSGRVSKTIVYCQDGAILNFPLFFFGSFLDGGDGSINLSYVDGFYVPNYQTFHENSWIYQWTSSYLASGMINTQFNGRNIAANLEESPLTITWRIPEIGGNLYSPTQVAAGNFPDAVKMEQVIELDFTANFNRNDQNTEIAGVLTLEAQLWFQPNLGLIKQEVTQVSAAIFGVSLPIEFNSSAELVSFKGE